MVAVFGMAIFIKVVLNYEDLVTPRAVLHTIGLVGWLSTLPCQVLLNPPHGAVEFDHETLAAEITTGSSIVRASPGHGMICA